MHCKTGNVLSMLNVLRKYEIYIKQMSSHFRHVTRFFIPCEILILVSITRPNSAKNITCSNIYDCPKQTIALRYCPIRQL